MFKSPMSPERYQEILDLLLEPRFKVKLASNPTTMGPSYISDKIVEILTAVSEVNSLSEEVERALTKARVSLNDLETEMEIRTTMALNDLPEGALAGYDAAGKRAYIRQVVEQSYIRDQQDNLGEGEIPPGQFQFWEDLRMSRRCEIELEALLKMIDRHRKELTKKDSGVRLQQKTIDVEMRIHKNPLSQQINNGVTQEFDGIIPHSPDDPDAGDEAFEGGMGLTSGAPEPGKEEPELTSENLISTQISQGSGVE